MYFASESACSYSWCIKCTMNGALLYQQGMCGLSLSALESISSPSSLRPIMASFLPDVARMLVLDEFSSSAR